MDRWKLRRKDRQMDRHTDGNEYSIVAVDIYFSKFQHFIMLVNSKAIFDQRSNCVSLYILSLYALFRIKFFQLIYVF